MTADQGEVSSPAESLWRDAGAETPSFVSYVVKYSLPILLPLYIVIWLVFFSGWIVPHPM